MQLMDSDRDHADLLFVRMGSGEPDQERAARHALEAWCGEHVERRKYVASLLKADALLNELPALPLPPAAHLPRGQAPAWRRPVPYLAAAAVVTLAVAIWIANPVLSTQAYTTAVGEQQTITLADGSHVVLNTDTQLRFSDRLHSREAHLIRGESLFDVEHKRFKPFRVLSEQTQVQVVGTYFSVRNQGDGSAVKVARGLVEVRASGDSAARLLTAGQQVATANGQFTADIRPVDVNSVSNWREGRLMFEAVPLRDMLRELQRYWPAAIVLQDKALGDSLFTGSFSTRQPDQVLQLLPSLYPVRVVVSSDGTAHIYHR